MGATGLAVGGACGCAAVEEAWTRSAGVESAGAPAALTRREGVAAVEAAAATLADDAAGAGVAAAACAEVTGDADSASFCLCLS